jgi:hypothetical protein
VQKGLLNVNIKHTDLAIKMSENITSARYSRYLFSLHEGLIRDDCSENFVKTILATIFSRGSYACPRCLTKVKDVKPARREECL